MALYTKMGDTGVTSLPNGRKLPKSDCIFEACGSIDELSSFVGLVIFKLKETGKKNLLTKIQKDLHLIMAVLAGKKTSLKELDQEVNKFERLIDKIESSLPKLNRFILPQGSELSSWFHILRTVCRRSERSLVRFFNSQETMRKQSGEVIKYLNRLSDLFFVLARRYNKQKELTI